MKTHTRTCVTVAAVRRSIIFQPLAVLMMAILMLPALSWMEGGGQFVVQAQQGQVCASTTNSIIQNYCTPTVGNHLGNNYYTFLAQLESDAVNAYLAAHNLPESDAHVIYDYGRADLRNAIRGYIISILLGVIKTPAEMRTGQQRALYLWLSDLVWANEIAHYTESYSEFLKWQHDPCHYTLVPEVASQYGITYNGAVFCGVSQSSVFNTVIPAPSYFKGVGLKKSYQAWADKFTCPVNALGVQDKSCKVAFQETTISAAALFGIATAGGAIVLASAGALGASIAAAAAGFLTGLAATPAVATGGSAAVSALFAVTASSVTTVGGAILGVAAPLVVIALAVAIGITAGVKAFEYDQALKDLNDLKNQLTAATNTPPDLSGMVTDTTGVGLFKIQNTVMAKTLRTKSDGTLVDLPSTAPLPAHGPNDAQFANEADGTASVTKSFKGWNGEIWTAQTWGGWFVQTCAPGTEIDRQADGTCIQADSLSADLHYVDYRFLQYMSGRFGSRPSLFALSRFSAGRFGNSKFIATRAAGGQLSNFAPTDPSGALAYCTATSWTGDVSPQSDLSECWNYVDRFVPMVAPDGSRTFATLTDVRTPTFIGSSVMAFRAGTPSTQTIKVQGDPHPTACMVSSNLPANFTINGSPFIEWFGTDDCNGFSRGGFIGAGLGTVTIQLAFDGALTAPSGVYSLTLKAVNAWNQPAVVIQTFTINLSPELAIISPDTMNVTSGVPANFTVVATGIPIPTLSVDGVDLGGMTFTDNGDGTATISGINSNTVNILECSVSSGSGGQPCALVATNSQGTYRQPFRVNLTTPPTAQMACNPCSATFIAGTGNRAILTSSGATTPVSWQFGFGPTPDPPPYPWLSLTDNGDGTAVLRGSPPYGTVGTFDITVTPRAQYTNARAGHYTINVADKVVFSTPNIIVSNASSAPGGTGGTSMPLAVMTAGSAAASLPFTISANTGDISLGTLLPDGLSFTSLGNTATISGSPAAGTGGQYLLRVSDDGGTAGTADQHLMLNVNEAPRITSNATATMFVGMPGSFAVTTTGFPSVSNHPIPANPLPSTDPSPGDGMLFTVTGLPADLHASNLNPVGFATGTLTIQGTPSAAGVYPVTITAQNGVGMPAQQTLMLNIVTITGPAPTSGTTCNGNYTGTFNGTLTVSAGQNCAFYGGGVTGNVTVLGGSFAATNATITGNVSIQGAAGFSIGAGTVISGNLSISSVASASTTNQLCGATVTGNLGVFENAVPITMGSSDFSCSGNSFGKSVDIRTNTAPIQLYYNDVAKNLSCSNNSSITGGNNLAAKKLGQCAGF